MDYYHDLEVKGSLFSLLITKTELIQRCFEQVEWSSTYACPTAHSPPLNNLQLITWTFSTTTSSDASRSLWQMCKFVTAGIDGKRLDEKCTVKVNLDGKKEKSSRNSGTFIAIGSNSVGEYRVEAKLVPFLKGVFLKHGNIVANCSLRSMSCVSLLFEVICRIIQKLQDVEFEKLTEVEVQSMLDSVNDLESMKVEFGWLRKRLEEISESLKLSKECSSLKEEMSKHVSDIEKLEKDWKVVRSRQKRCKFKKQRRIRRRFLKLF